MTVGRAKGTCTLARRGRCGRVLVACATVASVLVGATGAARAAGTGGMGRAPGGTVAVYPTPVLHAEPDNITVGPDSDLWFTEFNAGAVVRMTPAGAMKTFKVGPYPTGVVAGPDRSVWVSAGSSLAAVASSGQVHDIADHDRTTGTVGLNDIAWPGGGSLYVTGNNARGRWVVDSVLVKTGAVRTVVTFPADEAPESLAGGPRCGVWAAVSAYTSRGLLPPLLDRLGPKGVTRQIHLEGSDAPNGMACASNGALWVADGAALLRVAPEGLQLRRFAVPLPLFSSFVSATAVAVSPSGDVWFVGNDGVLGERTARGLFSYWPLPAGTSGGLAVDGHGTFTVNETRSEIAVLRY